MPGEVSFKNAFRARKAQYGSGCEDLRKPLPQMFTFVARTALPDSGQGLALRERVPHFLRAGDHGSSEDDVFLLGQGNNVQQISITRPTIGVSGEPRSCKSKVSC